MFRAVLRRRLEQHEPGAVADLHRRASAWFADGGDVVRLIEHALRAGDVHVALQRRWLELYGDGHANQTVAWIDRLPRATVYEYPQLNAGPLRHGARDGPSRRGRAVVGARRPCGGRGARPDRPP
jgi:LuxR family maltose regulon positive regulatory protein